MTEMSYFNFVKLASEKGLAIKLLLADWSQRICAECGRDDWTRGISVRTVLPFSNNILIILVQSGDASKTTGWLIRSKEWAQTGNIVWEGNIWLVLYYVI